MRLFALTPEERKEISTAAHGPQARIQGDSVLFDAVERLMTERMESVPTVEIEERLGQPTTCKVTRYGQVVFQGTDYSQAFLERQSRLNVEAELHWAKEKIKRVEALAEELSNDRYFHEAALYVRAALAKTDEEKET